MQEKITEWLNELALKVTPYTVKQYAYHLRRLAESYPARTAQEWTRAQLLEHLATLRADGAGDAYLKQVVGAYRNFFRFACGGDSPAETIPYPRPKRRKQRTLDRETAMKVLAAFDTSTAKGTRDLAITALMIDTGLRASEVCRLSVGKLDLAKRTLSVIIKGGHEGDGVFTKPVAAMLGRWLEIRNQYAAPECETVFCALHFGGGRTHNQRGQSLTREGLRDIFRKHAAKHGLPHFSPHDLRRTFATIAIRNGAPTRLVQKAGRWEDLLMVERYTQAITADDFEAYSPVKSILEGDE